MYYIKAIGTRRAIERSAVHIWNGKDTECKIVSLGGLDTSTYSVSEVSMGKSMCNNCLHNKQTPIQKNLW